MPDKTKLSPISGNRISSTFLQESQIHEVLKHYAKYLMVVNLIVGLSVLLGWQFDIGIIKRPIPGLVAMNPLTAINLILLVTSFLLVTSDRVDRRYRNAGYWFTLVLIFISLIRLAGSVFEFSPQIDQILFSSQMKEDALYNLSSRMAPNTATNFVFSGVVILFLRQRKNKVYIFQALTLLVVLIALFSIIGYIYRVKEFYGILAYIPMSIHTAFCFLMFGLSILLYSSDVGLMKEVTSRFAGGAVSRMLIPFAIIITVFLGFSRLYLDWKYSFSVEFGTAALVVSLIVILVFVIWFEAGSLNEKDKRRKSAEEQMRLTYLLLYSSIESHKDVLIFSIDTEFKFLTFNSAFAGATFQVYGTPVKIGDSMLDCITLPEEKEKARKYCEKALNGESLTSIEVYGELERKYFETRYNPIRNDEQEIIGVTVLSSDVTDRKIYEDEINTLNKELEAFSYSVAHDLRAPLRIIDGYSNMLNEDHQKDLNKEGQRLLNIISANARKMGQLIDDLLNFSKLGRFSVNKSQVNVETLIKAVVDEQVRAAGRDNIQINFGVFEDLYCDEVLIRHVFSNLISNAIKYSGKREVSIIEIDSSKTDSAVTYMIRDNGAGFDVAYADKLFGVFQRLHKENEFEGTGVGLAIVERIISKHGGEVWAEAEIDKGATFYFSLPLKK